MLHIFTASSVCAKPFFFVLHSKYASVSPLPLLPARLAAVQVTPQSSRSPNVESVCISSNGGGPCEDSCCSYVESRTPSLVTVVR